MSTFLGSLMEDVSDGINFFGEAIESTVQEIIDDVDHWAHPDDAAPAEPAEGMDNEDGAAVTEPVQTGSSSVARSDTLPTETTRSGANPSVTEPSYGAICLQGTSSAVRGDQQGADVLPPKQQHAKRGESLAVGTETPIDNTTTVSACSVDVPRDASAASPTRPLPSTATVNDKGHDNKLPAKRRRREHSRHASVLDDFVESGTAAAPCTTAHHAVDPEEANLGAVQEEGISLPPPTATAPQQQRLPPPSLFDNETSASPAQSGMPHQLKPSVALSASQVAFPSPQRGQDHNTRINHQREGPDSEGEECDEWELVAPPPMEDIDTVGASVSAVAYNEEHPDNEGKSPFQLV